MVIKSTLAVLAILMQLMGCGTALASAQESVLLYKQGKFKEAVQEFEASYSQSMKDPDAAYCYGQSLLSLDKFQRGIEVLRYVVKTFPGTDAAKQSDFKISSLKQQREYGKANIGIIGIKYNLTAPKPPVVQEIYPGLPADGLLKINDIITGVDGVSTQGLSVNQLYDRLVGKPDSIVTLTVDRAGTILSIPLTRVSAAKRASPTLLDVYRKDFENRTPAIPPVQPPQQRHGSM